jgi:2-C-methyl-D-erythritol 4-phosphate cytidylyltransferase
MQSALPKQFLTLNGLPVLMHTLRAFSDCQSRPDIMLVLHPEYHGYWIDLCARHHFTLPHTLVAGGSTRFHSVKNGLAHIDATDALVAVHDAVRPLTSAKVIDDAYGHAAAFGNAIVAVKSRDSVRRLQGQQSVSLLRDEIWLVQTPQTFRIAQLRKAYLQDYSPWFTDDASVVEQTGEHIHLVEGSHQNIKITFPEDIGIAELLLTKNSHTL